MPPLLQRIFAPIAIPHVLRVLAGFEALIFVLMLVLGPERAGGFMDRLVLDFGRVLEGEVWRLASFLVMPPSNPFSNFGVLWLVFAVLFLFLINDILEDAWGTSGLAAFFYTGILGCILGSVVAWMIHPEVAGLLAPQIPMYFGTACLLAAGTVAPKVEIRLFFFLPVPLGLVAAISGGFLLLSVLNLAKLHPGLLLLPLLGISNYLIWVLPKAFRGAVEGGRARGRKARFERAQIQRNEAFHTCEICGANDQSHPEREFRVGRDGREKCDACRDPQPENPNPL